MYNPHYLQATLKKVYLLVGFILISEQIHNSQRDGTLNLWKLNSYENVSSVTQS